MTIEESVKIFESEEYKAYHKKVVDTVVAIASEVIRKMFDHFNYLESYLAKEKPEDVAQTNWEDLNR